MANFAKVCCTRLGVGLRRNAENALNSENAMWDSAGRVGARFTGSGPGRLAGGRQSWGFSPRRETSLSVAPSRRKWPASSSARSRGGVRGGVRGGRRGLRAIVAARVGRRRPDRGVHRRPGRTPRPAARRRAHVAAFRPPRRSPDSASSKSTAAAYPGGRTPFEGGRDKFPARSRSPPR